MQGATSKKEKAPHTVQSPAASRPYLFPAGDEPIILEKIDVQTVYIGHLGGLGSVVLMVMV